MTALGCRTNNKVTMKALPFSTARIFLNLGGIFSSSVLTLVYGWHTVKRSYGTKHTVVQDEQSGSGMQLPTVMEFS